jgi:prolyl-tRNA synthetase
MRGREFIMKDAYSFHADEDSLKETYRDMDQAYRNMLRRCGLAFRAVEADSGAIGGSGSQEFMVLADAGEDEVLYTEDSQYAANVEKAVSLPPDAIASPFTSYEKRETLNCNTIESLAKFLKCSPTNIVKNVLYEAQYNNKQKVLVLVSIRGDQEVNEVKLQNELVKQTNSYDATSLLTLRKFDEKLSWLESNNVSFINGELPIGYIGPDLQDEYIAKIGVYNEQALNTIFGACSEFVKELIENNILTPSEIKQYIRQLSQMRMGDLQFRLGESPLKLLRDDEMRYYHPKFLRLVDETALRLTNFITGTNETSYHVVGASWGKEFPTPKLVVDIRTAKIGDRAIHAPSQTLQTARGIEAGHIFQLGTKYSQAMGATFTDEQGKEKPLVMGCYGVGVSRLAQSAVEQSYDKDGIIWPVAIAPYEVIIVIPNMSDEEQVKAAENLYQDLNNVGIEALLDDRNERAGVKFKDADLIGIPYRIVTGKSLKEGKVELVTRATKEAQMINLDEVVNALKGWVETAKK